MDFLTGDSLKVGNYILDGWDEIEGRLFLFNYGNLVMEVGSPFGVSMAIF